jgi:hypothetical protein
MGRDAEDKPTGIRDRKCAKVHGRSLEYPPDRLGKRFRFRSDFRSLGLLNREPAGKYIVAPSPAAGYQKNAEKLQSFIGKPFPLRKGLFLVKSRRLDLWKTATFIPR